MENATITISKLEYEMLIRENERLEIFKNYVRNQEYLVKKEVFVLLNMSEGSEEKCSSDC